MGRGSGRGGGGGLTKLQSVQSGAGDDHHAPTVTPTCRVDAQKRANQRVLALLMEQASLTQENLQLMEVCQVADPRCPATGMRLSLLCSLILL